MTPATAAPNPIAMLFPFAFMFVIFYLLVFRPQSQARKEHQRLLGNLKKHDDVVTSGGIFGTVVNVKPDTVTLRVDETVRLEVEKSAITRVIKSKGAENASGTEESRS